MKMHNSQEACSLCVRETLQNAFLETLCTSNWSTLSLQYRPKVFRLLAITNVPVKLCVWRLVWIYIS
jgi:hypothetical protein